MNLKELLIKKFKNESTSSLTPSDIMKSDDFKKAVDLKANEIAEARIQKELESIDRDFLEQLSKSLPEIKAGNKVDGIENTNKSIDEQVLEILTKKEDGN